MQKYQDTIFLAVITFIDKHFRTTKCSRSDEQHREKLIEAMLSFLWNVVDQTSIIPTIVNVRGPSTCLHWLSLSYLSTEEYRSIVCILHNIARHDQGALALNENGCLQIFRQFQQDFLEKKLDFIIDEDLSRNIRILSYMIRALLIDPNELGIDSMNNRKKDFQATGWLGIRLASHPKYIRFGRQDFDSAFTELQATLFQNRSKLPINHHEAGPKQQETQVHLKQWTVTEIECWFHNNGILCELYQFYGFQNGNQLLLYAEALKNTDWLKEYEDVQQGFENKFKKQQLTLSTHQFIKFVDALRELVRQDSVSF
ncbi:unnamed protein product [Rotaria sp. Silwood1]|nr:unnamed protein product [Rotaria sp. Silwood1]